MSHEIESTLKETRKFKPDAAWAKRANVAGPAAYKRMAAEGAKNPTRFWARMAKEHVSWFSTWKKVVAVHQAPTRTTGARSQRKRQEPTRAASRGSAGSR